MAADRAPGESGSVRSVRAFVRCRRGLVARNHRGSTHAGIGRKSMAHRLSTAPIANTSPNQSFQPSPVISAISRS